MRLGISLTRKYPCFVVQTIIKKIWKKYGIYEVLANDQGFFFFKFAQDGAHRAVIEAGPWHIAGKLLILKPWPPNGTKERLSTIPIWVQFSNVPLKFWTAEGLSYIASALGKPLCVDALTVKGKKISFARICVKINVDSPLLDTVEVEYANGDSTIINVMF